MSDSTETEHQPIPTPAAPETTPTPKVEELLAAAKQEAAANYDRYARAAADLDNFRKRTLREKDELRLYAATGLLEDIVPILDNLGLGLAAAKKQKDGDAIVAGLAPVMEQFKSVLARHGMKEVNPTGQRFDPNFQECISHLPSAEVAEEHVMQVVRLGYTLHGRLLRPASVVVSSGPAAAQA
jgi:molecular chaperone GrpE